jgi:hypothetical protein
MAGQIRVSSTSDDIRAVSEAAGISPETAAEQMAEEETAQPASAEESQAPENGQLVRRKSPVQARIDKITRQKHDAMAERDAARAEAAELRARIEASAPRPAEPTPPIDRAQEPAREFLAEGRAKYQDFDSVLERAQRDGIEIPQSAIDAAASLPNRADIAYALAQRPDIAASLLQSSPQEAAQKIREIGLFLAQREQNAALQSQLANHPRARMFAAELSKYADAPELLEDAPNIRIPTAIMPVIMDLDNGPAVTIHLARNPAICEELTRMSPATAIAAVGRLSAQLERGGGSAIISRAPSPIKTLSGSPTRSSVTPEEMSYPEWKAYREAGRAERRKKGYGI